MGKGKQWYTLILLILILILTACSKKDNTQKQQQQINDRVTAKEFVDIIEKIQNTHNNEVEYNININLKNIFLEINPLLKKETENKILKILSRNNNIDIQIKGISKLEGDITNFKKNKIFKLNSTNDFAVEYDFNIDVSFLNQNANKNIKIIFNNNNIFISKDIILFLKDITNNIIVTINQIKEDTISKQEIENFNKEIAVLDNKLNKINFIKISYKEIYNLLNLDYESLSKKDADDLINTFKNILILNKNLHKEEDNILYITTIKSTFINLGANTNYNIEKLLRLFNITKYEFDNIIKYIIKNYGNSSFSAKIKYNNQHDYQLQEKLSIFSDNNIFTLIKKIKPSTKIINNHIRIPTKFMSIEEIKQIYIKNIEWNNN